MVFIDKNRKKNLIFLLFTLPILCGVLFFADPHVVHAVDLNPLTWAYDKVAAITKAIWSIPAGIFLTVINGLLYAVFTVNGLLLMFAGVLMDWATNPANFLIVANNAGVYESWKFVRDILNLFFIVFFLFAAFATIFQVESYNYKKILLKLVIMALLVNFSFPIARFIIDVSNVLFYGIFSMGGFNQNTRLGGTLLSNLNVWTLVAPEFTKHAVTSPSTLTTQLIFSNIFLFVTAVTFMIIAALFVIRIAVLTVVIIFSPVGFVAGVFPGTKKFADQWWEALFNQSFFAPVMALMIVVALNVMRAMNSGNKLKESIDKTMVGQSVSGDYSTIIVSGATMAVPLIILWIGMMSAKKFGAIGADSVVGMGEKVAKWGAAAQFKAGWAGAKWVGRKAEGKLAQGKVTKWFSPTVLKEGFKSWSTAQHHEDMLPIEMAKARMHNNLNTAVSSTVGKVPLLNKFIHNDGTDYAFLEQNKQKAHYESQLKERGGGELTEDSTRQFLREAMNEHNTPKALAAMTALSRMNGLDNIAGDFGAEMLEKAKTDVKIVEDYNATMREMLERLGVDDQSAMKHMHNFGENAKSKGDAAFGDLYEVDTKSGKWMENGDDPALGDPDSDARVAARDTAHASTVAGNFRKMKAQTRQDVMHSRALFAQDVIDEKGNRKYGDLHSVGFAIAKDIINQDDVKNVSRKNGVVDDSIKNAYLGAIANPDKYPNFIFAYKSNPQFKAYVDESIPKGSPSMP